MKPVVDGLQADFGDRLAVRRLNAEKEGRAAFVAYALRGHPAYVIIDTTGDVLWKSVGEQPRDRIESAVRQSLGEE